jgi:hypothetical protein
MELEQIQIDTIMERIPDFELSYETVSHKKVYNYDIAMAIPFGKKCLCWFSYFNDEDVCYFMNLNKEKNVSDVVKIEHNNIELSLNTMLYGTLVQEEDTNHKYFIIEDIYYYCGIPLKKYNVGEKFKLLDFVMKQTDQMFHDYGYHIMLPFIWSHTHHTYNGFIPKHIESDIPYNIHHIQYRNCKSNITYLNVKTQKLNMLKQAKKGATTSTVPVIQSYECKYNKNLKSPQYMNTTVFTMKANMQSDIYHLFAYGKAGEKIYYDVAYIPNYLTSVKMNSIFRNIKENDNIDNIEESDDEDDFQNTDVYKHVDLNKEIKINCRFHRKFKKWVPIQPAPRDARVVHIGRLVYGYQDKR